MFIIIIIIIFFLLLHSIPPPKGSLSYSLGSRDFFISFVPAFLISMLSPLFLPSNSVPFSYFILTYPMRECLG